MEARDRTLGLEGTEWSVIFLPKIHQLTVSVFLGTFDDEHTRIPIIKVRMKIGAKPLIDADFDVHSLETLEQLKMSPSTLWSGKHAIKRIRVSIP